MFKIIESSYNSIQIQFEQIIREETNSLIRSFCAEAENSSLKGIKEIVPTYCAITIYFHPEYFSNDLHELNIFVEGIFAKIEEVKRNEFTMSLSKGSELLGKNEKSKYNRSIRKTQRTTSIIHKIPVCYEEEFALDIRNVESHTKLSKDEIISIHSHTPYLIYMLGFLPGFPYLGGMDLRLETPRLSTPRTKIPEGSVAIGGKQTGIYPVESPGGWQIIGRTPLKLFNGEDFIFKTGDKIQFVPISTEEFHEIKETQFFVETNNSISEKHIVKEEKKDSTVSLEKSLSKKEKCFVKTKVSIHPNQHFIATSGIKILSPGAMTTIQDNGITGFQKYGVSESGAMDKEAFYLANKIVGNKTTAATLETTLTGPKIQFSLDCDFAVTGATLNMTLDGKEIEMYKKTHANEGSVLQTGIAINGLRSYIAFSGGIIVPKIFNSFSTNTKSKIGGYFGRKLQSEDELVIGNEISTVHLSCRSENLNSLEKEILGLKKRIANSKDITLNVLTGPQFEFFSKQELDKFSNTEYVVSSESDRMGIRLKGESLNCKKTDIISDSIPYGAVQITSQGLPVIMASDRQTCGGYAKIASVIPNDMYVLSQAAPGTKIRFNFISRYEASCIENISPLQSCNKSTELK